MIKIKYPNTIRKYVHRYFCKNNINPDDSAPKNTNDYYFGYKKIDKSEKQSMVNSVFSNVSSKYDIMNDVMSLFIHRYWKSYFISEIGSLKQQNIIKDDKIVGQKDLNILDVASGTGDIALRINDTVTNANITLYDINNEMLEEAKQKFAVIPNPKNKISFEVGNAEDLSQFEDNYFDLYTIVFGIRNVTDVDKALREAYRVLKPGGRFLCMEFSKVQNPIFNEVYKFYNFNVIPMMGKIIANDYDSYKYLAESIDKFYSQQEFVSKMEANGFQYSKFENMNCGICAIYSGFKL